MFYQSDVIITAYIDDLLIFGPNIKLINSTENKSDKKFDMKDIGAAAYFLGMQITRKKKFQNPQIFQIIS